MASHRILVVDDEEDLLELVRYNLSKEGYRVDLRRLRRGGDPRSPDQRCPT